MTSTHAFRHTVSTRLQELNKRNLYISTQDRD